ncbi:phosphatase PAP2 family protein [Legionella fairfieldensis]|uniref:phosphatase PAP2 family protein n=1 Tax=Legionella fairfieldensis TaxID=45064 RepID=UPI001F5F1A50|nr:phosphatase PAP2 family protein [Legionella fairfieldensis]
MAFAVNYFIFKYPGVDYFPPGTYLIAIILFLILLGTYILFGTNSLYFLTIRELIYFLLVMTVIVFATCAVQFTPFHPIDRQLIAIDNTLSINLQKIMAWTSTQPKFKEVLLLSYCSLPYQMCYIPLALIVLQKYGYVREYYALLLSTTFIGFLIYYFLPTMGPASFISSSYFFQEQYATGLKFNELHHYQLPSTIEGGLISMPSFHTIWAWLCLYTVRCWPLVFILLLPINLLLIAACVLLGWHYFIDLIGSLIVLLVAHSVYFYCVKQYNTTDNDCQVR